MGQIVVVYIYHLFTTDVSRRYSTNGDGLDNLLQSLQIPFSQPVIRKCPIYQICERAKVKNWKEVFTQRNCEPETGGIKTQIQLRQRLALCHNVT